MVNLIKKIDKKISNFIDNLVYGKEDIFMKNARRREFERMYGNKFVDAETMIWIPGWFAYANIKELLKDKEYTTKQKIGIVSLSVGCDLIKDAFEFGGLYGLYKLGDFVLKQIN
jgi:hypothetical protein